MTSSKNIHSFTEQELSSPGCLMKNRKEKCTYSVDCKWTISENGKKTPFGFSNWSSPKFSDSDGLINYKWKLQLFWGSKFGSFTNPSLCLKLVPDEHETLFALRDAHIIIGTGNPQEFDTKDENLRLLRLEKRISNLPSPITITCTVDYGPEAQEKF